MRRYFSKEDFLCFLNLLEENKVTPLHTESVEDGSTDTYYFMKEVFLGEEIILYQIYSGGVGIIQDTPVSPWEDYAEVVYDDLIMNGEYKMYIETE
jgi:hypothetical protein